MGEEEQTQQKPPRISPETREKIKRFGKRAAIGAGILVAGIAIGAGMRGCSCRRPETGPDLNDPRIDRCAAVGCRSEESLRGYCKLDSFGQIEMEQELMQRIAGYAWRQDKLAGAVNDFILLSISDFGFNKEMLDYLFNLSGENVAYSLRLLRMFAEHYENDMGEIGGAVGRICEAVNLIAQKSGDGKEEVFGKLFDLYQTGISDRFGPRGTMEFKALGIIELIAQQSAGKDDILLKIKIISSIMRKEDVPADKYELARIACNAVNAIVGEGGANIPNALLIYGNTLSTSDFDPGLLDEQFAKEIARMASLAAEKSGGQPYSAMEMILKCIGTKFVKEGTQEWVPVDPRDITAAVTVFAERSDDAESFMAKLETIKNYLTTQVRHPEDIDADWANRLCDLEQLIGERAGRNGAMHLFYEMLREKRIGRGELKLVEIAIGNGRGQSVISALNRINWMHNGDDGPFASSSRAFYLTNRDYEDAFEIVNSIFRSERLNIERLVNFAYGVHILGAGKVGELYNKFGIEYFSRYNQDILEEIGRNSDVSASPQKPILLAVVGKVDWNGAFYSFGNTDMAKLMNHYKMLICEVDSEQAFYIKVREIRGWYGKISALIISGHGSPDSIALGGYGSGSGVLESMDENRIMQLRESFLENPVIVLNSCSTGSYGQSIAGTLSRVLGAHVLAPTRDAGLTEYLLDGEGAIVGANYDAPTREYVDGRSSVINGSSP